MTPKEIKIKIGNIEFNTANLPNKGLNISNFNETTQKILNIFDTDNKKGHLSKQELTNMISIFASFDENNNNEIDTGIQDGEVKNLINYLAKKISEKNVDGSQGEKYRQAMQEYDEAIEYYKNALELTSDPEQQKKIKMLIKQVEAYKNFTKINYEGLSSVNELAEGVDLLDLDLERMAENISSELKIADLHLKRTSVIGFYTDDNGNYYKTIDGTCKLLEGVEKINDDGSYEKREKIGNSNVVKITAYSSFDSIKYLSFDGENVGADEAANAFGWKKEYTRHMGFIEKFGDFFRHIVGAEEPKGEPTNRYIDLETGERYIWNEEDRTFTLGRPVDLEEIKNANTDDGIFVNKLYY